MRTIRAKRDPFFQMVDNGDGLTYPLSEAGLIMPHEQWQALKERVDQFYARASVAEIEDHNEEARQAEAASLDLGDFYQKRPISMRMRRQVFERDGFRCRHCGSRDRLSVDHIRPESKGGVTELDNLQTLCGPCNSRKGTDPDPRSEKPPAQGK